MEMKENNQKKMLLSVLGVAILVVAVIGISFAAYSTFFKSEANSVTTGTIMVSYDESGSAINVADAMPMTDENGAAHLWVQLKSIFVKKTDYVDMVGASASTVGTHGLVPAPSIGSQNIFVKWDGSWAEVQGIGENN